MGRQAGKGIMDVKIDHDNCSHQRRPFPSCEVTGYPARKHGGEPEVIQGLSHAYQPSVPDKDVPGHTFLRRVLPGQCLRREKDADSQQGHRRRLDAVECGGPPHGAHQNENGERDFLIAFQGTHRLKLFSGHFGGLRRAADPRRTETIDHPGNRGGRNKPGNHRGPKPAGPVDGNAGRLQSESGSNGVAGLARKEHRTSHDVALIQREHEIRAQKRRRRAGKRLVKHGQGSSDGEDHASYAGRVRRDDARQNEIRCYEGVSQA